MTQADEEIIIMKSFQSKFDKIEAKDKCIRVQFLDWLSAKMLHWSEQIKAASDRIDAPCIIKVDKKPATLLGNQADYFYDYFTCNYIDIKGLKAGKSKDECTYTMDKERGLISYAQLFNESVIRNAEFAKKMDDGIKSLRDELNQIKGEV